MQKQKASKVSSRKKSLIAVGAVLIVAVSASLASVMSPKPASIATDSASATIREAAFAKTGGTLTATPIAGPEIEKAIATMQLSPEEKQVLHQDIESGKTKLAWINVWDDQAEDGDVIRITAGAGAVDVSLRNQPMKLAVPIGPVSITGLRDGRGGITAGIATSSGSLGTPVMVPGQTIIVELR